MIKNFFSREEAKITFIGVSVNLTLAILKISVGVFVGSYALISDGFDSFSDLASDFVVFLGIYFANLPPDENHTHGHGKIQTLCEVAMGTLLLYAAIQIGLEAAVSIYEKKTIGSFSLTVILVPIFATVIKEWLFRYTMKKAKKLDNSTLVASAWHHRSDSLSTLIVLVGLVVIYFIPEWAIIDSYLGFLISAMILKVGFDIIFVAIKKITDTVPTKNYLSDLYELVSKVREVENPHDLGLRYLGNKIAVEIHIEVNPLMSVEQSHEVCEKVSQTMKDYDTKIIQVIVHVDPGREKKHSEKEN
ncbi:cation transporter [bacterium]|nr:cation transporter [bacterium]